MGAILFLHNFFMFFTDGPLSAVYHGYDYIFYDFHYVLLKGMACKLYKPPVETSFWKILINNQQFDTTKIWFGLDICLAKHFSYISMVLVPER